MKGEIFYKCEAIEDGTQAQTTTGFDSIIFFVKGGTNPAIHESDDGATFAAADAKYVLDDNGATIRKMAYIGYKKYVKIVGGTPKVSGVKFNPIEQK